MNQKHIFLFITLFLLWGDMQGQQPLPCVLGNPTGISTDPDNFVNPQCCPNGQAGCPEFFDLQFFDWRVERFPYSGAAPGGPAILFPDGVSSPFWNRSNVLYSELWDEEIGGGDYLPEDGWELIQAGVPSRNPNVINHSYLVLYNKVASTIRVVFSLARSPGDDYNSVNVGIRFDDDGPVTALLHPRTGKSQPMDKTSEREAQASVTYTNEDFVFMYADFPVEYDPCTCGQLATVKVLFTKVKEQQLELYGRYMDVERSLANIENFGGFLERDFLTQTYATAQYREDIGGSHTFATFDRLAGHYNVLRQQQAGLKSQYEFFQLFSAAVSAFAPIGAPVLKGVKFSDKIKLKQKAEVLGLEISEGEVGLTGALLLESIVGGVNLLGAPLKARLDAVGSQVNSLGATTFSHGEMALGGRLTTETSLGSGPTFRVPGRNAFMCTSLEYPVYNEVLGRFALLETPRVTMSTFHDDEVQTPQSVNVDRFSIDPASIRYSFNPAAGINTEATEIYAALRIRYRGLVDATPPAQYLDFTNVIPVGNSEGVFMTPLMPLSCIGSFIAAHAYYRGFFDNGVEVDLMLAVEYVFGGGSGGSQPQRSFQVYSYPLQIDRWFSADFNNWYSSSPTPTPAYSSSLTLATTHYTQSQTIFAWGDITIEGTLTTAPGVRVEIIAPNITVLDGARIGEDIWLRNGETPFGQCAPLAPVSQTEVATFCASNKYKANQSLDQPDEEGTVADLGTGLEVLEPAGTVGRFSVQVEPNPASDYAMLRVALPEGGDLSAHLSDLNGQVVAQLGHWGALPPGEHLFDAPMQGLSAGMYILTVRSAAGVRSVKVVKR